MSTILEEAQQRLAKAQQDLNAATEGYTTNVAAIRNKPDAPGTSYEDFMKSVQVDAPKTPALDPKKERKRANLMNIADAINAVGGIVGASLGADAVQTPSLSAANQARYDKLTEQRKAEQDAYTKALMQQQSHAMSLAEAYRRRRQQEDAAAIALEEDKLTNARNAYNMANDEYNRVYKQGRDAASDARSDRSYNAQQDRYAKTDERNARNDERLNRNDVDRHNRTELNDWEELSGGRYVRKANYPSFVSKVYDELSRNKTVAEAEKTAMATIKAYVDNGATDDAYKLMEALVKRYLDSTDEAKAKVANDAATASGLLGTPDLWEYDNQEGNAPANENRGESVTI